MQPLPVPMSAMRGARARSRAAADSASSTMNSVSGRGISTAGVTAEIEAPEFADADDVGDRLARDAPGDQSENVGSSAAGAGVAVVR